MFHLRHSTLALFSISCRWEPIDCVVGLGEAVPEASGNIKVPYDVKLTLVMLQPEKKKSPPSVSTSVGWNTQFAGQSPFVMSQRAAQTRRHLSQVGDHQHHQSPGADSALRLCFWTPSKACGRSSAAFDFTDGWKHRAKAAVFYRGPQRFGWNESCEAVPLKPKVRNRDLTLTELEGGRWKPCCHWLHIETLTNLLKTKCFQGSNPSFKQPQCLTDDQCSGEGITFSLTVASTTCPVVGRVKQHLFFFFCFVVFILTQFTFSPTFWNCAHQQKMWRCVYYYWMQVLFTSLTMHIHKQQPKQLIH